MKITHTLALAFLLGSTSLHFGAVTDNGGRNISDGDIFRAGGFQEPLVPVASKSTPLENEELNLALRDYVSRTDIDDRSAIINFIRKYPTSCWRVALLTNLSVEGCEL